MKSIWVASHNAHKVEEISAILKGYKVSSLADLQGFTEPEENGSTYEENAEIKARALYNKVHQPVFADDTGLEVKALGGQPGLHTARYAGEPCDNKKNVDKLLAELKNITGAEREARFVCVIVYIDGQGVSHKFEGILPGFISTDRRGKGGFGYDPVFYIPEKGCCTAELPAEEKNRISHRARALEGLVRYLTNNGEH